MSNLSNGIERVKRLEIAKKIGVLLQRPAIIGSLLLGIVLTGLIIPVQIIESASYFGIIGRIGVIVILMVFALRSARGSGSLITPMLWLSATQLLSAVGSVVNEPARPITPLLIAMIAAFVGSFAARARSAVATRAMVGLSTLAWAWAISPRVDLPATVLAAAAIAAPALTIAARELRKTKRNWLPIGFIAIFGWVSALSSIARAYAVAKDVGQNLTVALVVAAVVSGLIALFSAVLSIIMSKDRLIGSVAAVIGVTAALISGITIDAAPEKKVITELLSYSASADGVSKMTADSGAGPKARFRGYTFERCDELNDRDCFITHYDDIAIRKGLRVAIVDITGRVQNNEGMNFPAHCHQVVHNLGQIAIELTNDFAKVSSLDPQVCGTGFTHGLWELTFEQIGDEAIFTSPGKLCAELNMVTDWYKWSCNHILGHILTTRMMSDPSRAMEFCNEVAQRNITDCLAGGWMGFFQDDYILQAVVESGNAQDLFNICYGVESGMNKYFCYQELFPAIYKVYPEDADAGKSCIELSENPGGVGQPWDSLRLDYATRCVMGLSRAIAVSSDYDYRKIAPRCLSMPLEAQAPCLASAGASIVLNTGSVTAGNEVCKEIVDKNWRGYCYYWTRHSHDLLADGPNSDNMPKFGETRLPGDSIERPGKSDTGSN